MREEIRCGNPPAHCCTWAPVLAAGLWGLSPRLRWAWPRPAASVSGQDPAAPATYLEHTSMRGNFGFMSSSNNVNHFLLICLIMSQNKQTCHAGHLTCEFPSILFVFGVNQTVQLLTKCLQVFFLIHVWLLTLRHRSQMPCLHHSLMSSFTDFDLWQLFASQLPITSTFKQQPQNTSLNASQEAEFLYKIVVFTLHALML